MSAQTMTMPMPQIPSNRNVRGPVFRPTPASTARAYTPRRRNALIPLPLLPAPPPHAIIKSVTVVHQPNRNNVNNNGGVFHNNNNTGNPRANGGRRRSSSGHKNSGNGLQINPQNSGNQGIQSTNVPFPKALSPTSPTSPHQQHQLPARNNRGNGGGQRRRSSAVYQGPFVPAKSLPSPPRDLTNATSTYVVTVRLPPPPTIVPPVQPPAPKQQIQPLKQAPSVRRLCQEVIPLPPKPKFNRPRVSSPLAVSPVLTADEDNDDDAMDVDVPPRVQLPQPAYGTALHPRSFPRPRSKLAMPGAKGKPASLTFRKCVLLCASGPEKGRRIWCLGVRLALEIWEAEECMRAQEQVEVVREPTQDAATLPVNVVTTTTTTETWSDVVSVDEL